jgi:hypothetical protein
VTSADDGFAWPDGRLRVVAGRRVEILLDRRRHQDRCSIPDFAVGLTRPRALDSRF